MSSPSTLLHCNKVASLSQVLGVVGVGTDNILTRVLTVVLLSKKFAHPESSKLSNVLHKRLTLL